MPLPPATRAQPPPFRPQRPAGARPARQPQPHRPRAPSAAAGSGAGPGEGGGSCGGGGSDDGRQLATPWQLSHYYTKKLRRETDELGRIVQSPEAIAEPAGWEAGGKWRLAVRAVARDAGVPEGELLQRVESLKAVLPDVGLQAMPPGDAVRLACRVDDVAAKLLRLKGDFPRADVSRVASQNVRLLLLDLAAFDAAVDEVRSLLAAASDPSALLEAQPLLLDPQVLRQVLGELQRLFGAAASPLSLLERDPALALSCQSLQGQARGDRDAAYLGNIFAKPAGGQEGG